MSWFKLCVVVVILTPNLIFNGIGVSAQTDPIEGSGEVCDIEASSCPDDKCCSKKKCDEEGKTVKCCPDHVDFAHWIVNEGQPLGCSQCPTCCEYIYISFLYYFIIIVLVTYMNIIFL